MTCVCTARSFWDTGLKPNKWCRRWKAGSHADVTSLGSWLTEPFPWNMTDMRPASPKPGACRVARELFRQFNLAHRAPGYP